MHADARGLMDRLRAAAIISVVLSVWLVISPWVLSYSHLHGSTWNTIGVAWVASFLAGLRITGADEAGWLSWLHALVGLYLIASPWLWGDAGHLGLVVNQVVCGLIITGVALWSALSTPTLFSRS
ncbi:MAG: SPW repeat protein [Sphaerobacter sp.]|nr:SPW repeat protein [Sphaerobacter sp.]